ncbi:carbamoyl-phosphate synthase (glutamine-hydrolyzing) large subunit [Aminipila butyrica]|uniref:Carbamoyl phosphate synthase large chain n=1 Tax=Aminipila butyrica TaxID=433296 RepID=A0A858BXI7_9FIRM|nr:carbamoyl-phosphate synthase (glutamine-hydrolyzing) large subunit [Aminipila butyrica]QIB70132.1 carbamoyl-phosphate synthase (glutamine-hydrolyzing) large subunit [Aminipila butyrica]
MPKKNYLKKVLIIGSGPIIIGQAAEFDYAGTQACKAIKEEGIHTVLVNSNPATIMTDRGIADTVYMEPLTEEAMQQILQKERPDGILAGFGGQTGLNLAMELDEKGVLQELGIELLGINKDSIRKAEDREEFRDLMLEIGEPIPKSIIATSLEECQKFVQEAGYPVIIRPAFTLGGTGGGIASNDQELELYCQRGLESSAIGQILLEKSVAGWKEVEYEVMRDSKDNCIIICSMENLDPVGVHTGDSIVVAPTQTLRDEEYQMLRDSSLKIIRSLKIEGGCNVQFALNPITSEYIVIEVNPRVSRSSALASKAAGYPIAKIAAKISLGYNLDELKNYVTQSTSACFEPTLDYCVVKFPKWPFDKFGNASRKLGTQMKATGEVMSICRTFESALLKAVTSLEVKCNGLRVPFVTKLENQRLIKKLEACDDERIFCVAEAMRRGYDIEKIFEKTKIDRWFLNKIQNIISMEKTLASRELDAELLLDAESMGFTDVEILALTGTSREVLQDMRVYNDIYPVYKVVDTCGGEFDAVTPYYYSCYEGEDESCISANKKILVIGSGPIRIGQGIEFDYCCVQGVWAIKELGYEAILMNNNPETVSTDFDTSDKLYFESLHVDNVMNVIKKERPYGVVLQFGGQTSLNLAEQLHKRSIKLLGTGFKSIDLAEDREKFNDLLQELGIPTPEGCAVTDEDSAFKVVKQLSYPVVVRPSYVIGGRAMQVVYSDEELGKYLREAVSLTKEHPVLIDKYIQGKEMEVDAICDGEDILIPGIMEHIERTGVHSGDSMTVYPPHTLSQATIDTVLDYTERIAKALNVLGLVNIQYAFDGQKVYVIEVNPRASRTVPILSKVTGVPMIKLAISAMLGKKLNQFEYGTGLYKKSGKYAVKVPVFSGAKLTDVDVTLGPEMKSTGEVLGIDEELSKAIYKGFLAANIRIPIQGGVYFALRDTERTAYTLKVVKMYREQGYQLYCSPWTHSYFVENGIEAVPLEAEEAKGMIGQAIQIFINVPSVANRPEREDFMLRRKAIEHGLPVLTCMDTAEAFMTAVGLKAAGTQLDYCVLG